MVPKNSFYNFPDLVETLIASKKKVLGYLDKSYWLDIGRPDDYITAIEKFKHNKKLFLKS
jgi:NDP-sugar pyrophosphorylase family protein